MRKFTADYVFTIDKPPLKNGVVITDDLGKIISILEQNEIATSDINHYQGVIIPGFINAHCHLELSHLYQQIPQKQGLVNFIKSLLALRDIDEETQLKAAQAADKTMWENGIVAVGDICNTSLTSQIKNHSEIKYHTFVEMLGFDDSKANQIFANALSLKAKFTGSKSIVPHAPYTVSNALFALINSYSQTNTNLISLHNQESQQENLLYQSKTGDFVELYQFLGINIEAFRAKSKSSLAAVLPILSSHQKKILVHNTFTNATDIALAHQYNPQLYWCFCPNANLYIENQLPQIPQFLDNNFNFTIGTDSLASNQKLCMLNEMRTLLNHFANLTFAQTLRWATLNGAQFFGFDDELGSITVGKTPGLNLITNFKNGTITPQSEVIKLI